MENVLSFEYVASENKRVDSLWYGETKCYNGGEKPFSMCKLIEYFQTTKYETIDAPLKNLHKIKTKYWNSVQVLAFAFTSVFAHLLGNHTNDNLIELDYLHLQLP